MKKEIKELVAGKSINFMATVIEKLSEKSIAEFEASKIKVAKTMLGEAKDDEDDKEDKKKLTGKQKELDADKDGDIEADDFADLRKGKKKEKVEEESLSEESFKFEVRDKKSGRNSIITVQGKTSKEALATARKDDRYTVVGAFKNDAKAAARAAEMKGKK